MVHSGAPNTPRDRRRRGNLQRLLDAAMDIIVTSGIEGLSMARLADAADYTPGALYRYFRNKDAIVSALVTQVIDDAAAELAERPLPRLSAPPTEHLRHIIELALNWQHLSETQPHRFALVSMLMAAPRLVLTTPDDVQPAVAAVLRAFAPIVRALNAAASTDAGALTGGPAPERAIILFASAQGILQLRKSAVHAPDLHIDVSHIYRAMLTALLAGWGADSAALQSAMNDAATKPGSPS